MNEIDEHALRYLSAKRDFGSIVEGTEPEILKTQIGQQRLEVMRREMERSKI
jgi:hypothetical protein